MLGSQVVVKFSAAIQEMFMQRLLTITGVLCLASLLSWSQAAPAKTATPTKPAAPKVHTAPSGRPTAIINTSVGKMRCVLFPDVAPIGVANFIGLANGTKDWISPATHNKKHGVPLYDGTIFHRVIPEFMIQGGDPAGTGEGDPGYAFKNETSPTVKFDRPGRLAYANAGRDTNGSQFFITEQAFVGQQAATLNGNYTIFGQCDPAAVALVKQIARMPRNDNDRPLHPVKILHISVTQSIAAARPRTTAKPTGTVKKVPAKPVTTPK
jgi:peptidyl-prolyl cis-trans isomerase A (cyclophilin A)